MALASHHLCTYALAHTYLSAQTTEHIFTGTHSFGAFLSTYIGFCAVFPALSSGLVSGLASEGSGEVEQSGNSLLIPAEPAFRVAAGLLPNRHRRSRAANQRGTKAMMRARAGVGEWMRGIGRVQNKRGSGGEGVGEVAWIEGGPMAEIGLAEKSPPETRGGGEKLPI